MDARLDAPIAALREEMIETLTRWIRIPSEKLPEQKNAPFGAPLAQMLETALEDARRLGFETRNFDNYVGDVRMGEGSESMGILAHLDVVPAGDGWTMDPFGAEIRSNRMYGRGTSDDKGPAVAALFAMKAVRDAGIKLRREVRLILGCDEESGSACIAHYKKFMKMPDFGFSPDADYPVINTEKGIEGMTLEADFDGEANAEYPVFSVTAGERANVIPGLAYAEIGCTDFDAFSARLNAVCKENGWNVSAQKLENGHAYLTSVGIAGHGAMPASGKNAAGQLLLALNALGVGGGCKAYIKCLAERIGLEYDGKKLGVSGSDDISGALTLNLGILRITPQHGSATLNIRHPVLFDGQQIASIIGLTVKEAGIRVENVGDSAPLHVPASSFIVSNLLKVYHDVTGREAYTIAIGGGTYSRTMDNCVAFGANFPGEEDRAHIADECINLDNLLLNVRIFAEAIVALAG